MIIDSPREYSYTLGCSIGLAANLDYRFTCPGVGPWGGLLTNEAGVLFLLPLEELDNGDRGDDVQRRFRYQHGYGVILLAAASRGDHSIVAIWCEHLDDILVERDDDKFDCYQIKTSTPQDGRITTSNEGFGKALSKWATLEQEFGSSIHEYNFVSNSKFEDRPAKLASSPVALLKAAKDAANLGDLKETFVPTVDKLACKLEVKTEVLFQVLKKMRLVKGPELESYDAEISHIHLGQLPVCAGFSASELDGLRDELMQRVFSASSLEVKSPSKHLESVLTGGVKNPVLRAKRLDVSDFRMIIDQRKQMPLRFAPRFAPLVRATSKQEIDKLTEKFMRGDLSHYLETMTIRKLCAENHLLELASKYPDDIEGISNTIASKVKGICDDAHLFASKGGEPFGKQMLRLVISKLETVAQERPSDVHGCPFEVLAGVAGLLTDDCKVWWSEPFDISGRI